MTVLAGAFVGYDGRWLEALYDAGIKGSYDALSVHFYDLTFWGVRRTRAVQRAHGDRAPLWIAESGYTSCRPRALLQDGHRCLTRAAQARFLADLVRQASRRPYVGGLVVYAVQDTAWDDFGLLDRAGRRKPAWTAFRRAVAARAAALRRVALRLRRRGGAVVASGSGPAGDLYTLSVRRRGALRWRVRFQLDRDGTFRVRLPAALGRSGLTVGVRQHWTNGRAVRRI
jgi:hypothetical protein